MPRPRSENAPPYKVVRARDCRCVSCCKCSCCAERRHRIANGGDDEKACTCRTFFAECGGDCPFCTRVLGKVA